MKRFITLLPLWSGVLHGAEPDWGDYAALLQRHVRPATKNGTPLNSVHYAALKSDPLLPKALGKIASHPQTALATPQEKLAFHINAYNLLAIKMVVDHWPANSIKDASGFLTPVWKMDAGAVSGQVLSLDELEHKILRPMGEPRIHLAIVCASVSCPDLRLEPYTAEKLSQQLDDQSKTFLANTAKGLRLEGATAHVSRIFEWFGQDFQSVGGVDAFVRRHAPPLPATVDITPDLPYDWATNGQ